MKTSMLIDAIFAALFFGGFVFAINEGVSDPMCLAIAITSVLAVAVASYHTYCDAVRERRRRRL